MNEMKECQVALKSMDMKELLNTNFKGEICHENHYTLRSSEILNLCKRKGMKIRNDYGDDEVEDAIEECFFLPDYVENYFENSSEPICEIIAEELGFNLTIRDETLQPTDMDQDYDDMDFALDLHDSDEADYVAWWCENFSLEYDRDGNSFIIHHMCDEQYITFLFFHYVENGEEKVMGASIDFTAGYGVGDITDYEIVDKLVELDKRHRFFTNVAYNSQVTKLIEAIQNRIDDTKEVLF